MLSKLSRRDISILISNSLEHFDHALCSFLAPILAPVFFPECQLVTQLIITYSVLASSLISRPIGVVIFSSIASSSGPLTALAYSVMGAAVTMLVIGLLPGYQLAGWAAPAGLILARIIQGVFVGGEVAIAKIYIMQHKSDAEALTASYLYQVSTMSGIILASLASWLVITCNYPSAWRWCFCLSGAGGFLGYWLRRSCFSQQQAPQSAPPAVTTQAASYLAASWLYCCQQAFYAAARYLLNYSMLHRNGCRLQQQLLLVKQQSAATLILLKHHQVNIRRIAAAHAFSYLTYVLPFIVMNNFVPLVTSVKLATMMSMNTSLLVVDLALIPVIGRLVAGYDPVKIMLAACAVFAVTIMPLWFSLNEASQLHISLIRLAIIICGICFLSPLNFWQLKLLGANDQYLIAGIGEVLGSAAGRLTPIICLLLWQITASSVVISSYFSLVSLAAFWAVKPAKCRLLTNAG